jgi:hypothetical protein
MTQPVKLYPETSPSWLRSILPLETPFEKARRIEKAFKEVEDAKANAKAVYEDRLTHLDDYELFLHDQWKRVTDELEAMGEHDV